MAKKPSHIVIDARIRRSSTGRPVDRFLEYLQASNTPHRYTVLTEPSDPWQPSNQQFTKRPINYRQYSFNPVQQLSYALKLYSLRPDLVYFTQTGQQPLFYYGKQATLTHDLTMLRFTRAGRLPQWLHSLRMIGYRLLYYYGNKKAAAIIVPSDFVKHDLQQHYPFTSRKTTVVYEAAENKLTTKPEQITNIVGPFILHVGSPFPHKNIGRLVSAFEVLLVANPKLTLVLAGKREYYFNQLEQKVIHSSPAAKNIIITGFVTDGQLRWLYQNALCYALPSLSEGFGLPGLEAMVNGTPLVSSSATCLPEVYGNAAHYFDPLSVNDMAAKISQVITDKKLRQTLVTNGHNQVQKYSWQTMTSQMVGVLESCL
jgi:glycosyltransferase involved in cell wall biosynthesis